MISSCTDTGVGVGIGDLLNGEITRMAVVTAETIDTHICWMPEKILLIRRNYTLFAYIMSYIPFCCWLCLGMSVISLLFVSYWFVGMSVRRITYLVRRVT